MFNYKHKLDFYPVYMVKYVKARFVAIVNISLYLAYANGVGTFIMQQTRAIGISKTTYEERFQL